MSVQSYVQQYQSSSAPGIIAEGNPYDIGTFIVSEQGIRFGLFCAIASSENLNIKILDTQSKIVGVVAKQLDRVSINRGLEKESTSEKSLVYEAQLGKTVAILRMGYVNVICTTPWNRYDDMYVRVKGDGIIGSVASNLENDSDYFQIIHATFISYSSKAGIAKIFLDLRLPIRPGQSLSNVWTTS